MSFTPNKNDKIFPSSSQDDGFNIWDPRKHLLGEQNKVHNIVEGWIHILKYDAYPKRPK
jgi:hypothetical protein